MKRIDFSITDEYLGHILYLPCEIHDDLPLLIYLHGAGERGDKLDHLARHGIPRLIEAEEAKIPAIVLCPQCPSWLVWNNIVTNVKQLIDKTVIEYRIKRDRICITGSSMGGYGTWEMGMTYPNFFSGIAPVAGGGMQWRAQKLINTPVRAYHGSLDDMVEPVNSELMVKELKAAGGNVELNILNGFGHNDGIEEAYSHTDLIRWLLMQKRTNFEPVSEVCAEHF